MSSKLGMEAREAVRRPRASEKACFRVSTEMEWRGYPIQALVSQDKALHQGHVVRNRNRDSLLRRRKVRVGVD